MNAAAHTWAVVLAAGEGTRLASLTRDASGNATPKQFCSLNGGKSLVQEAIQRAQPIASLERTCAIVAEQHTPHWRRVLRTLPAANVIVQPQNRGTAHGILLCVLTILARDPFARIVFLPADHFVLDEEALARALRNLASSLNHHSAGLTLIGIEPDEADPELGYIVPGEAASNGLHTVAEFVEKPAAALAAALVSRKALWNSFIFGGTASAILALLRSQLGRTVEEMATALTRDDWADDRSALTELYEHLPNVDFSRAVVQQSSLALRVIAAPACGWNDLGTPRRVADTLRRLRGNALMGRETGTHSVWAPPAIINLAAQQARLAMAS